MKTGGSLIRANAALMMVGISAVVFGVSEGSDWGWSSGKTLGVLIGGLAVCGIWVSAEVSGNNPVDQHDPHTPACCVDNQRLCR